MRKDRNTQRRRNTQRNKKTELWEVLTFRGSGKRNRRKEAQNTDSEKIQPAKEWEWGVVNDVSNDGIFHKMGPRTLPRPVLLVPEDSTTVIVIAVASYQGFLSTQFCLLGLLSGFFA